MTIWILAFVLMAITVSAGYVQGAIRVGFSLLGIVVGMFLALPLSPIFLPILPLFGITSEFTKAVVAPIVAFFMVGIAFKVGGTFVHRKIDYHFKYRMTDAQRTLWERMNRRVGSAVASIGGLIYLVLACVLISVLGYGTTQVGASQSNSSMLHFFNRMAEDLQSTRMDKVVGGLNPAPTSYFETCDFIGFILQNREVIDRITAYPPIAALTKVQYLDDDPAKGSATDFQKIANNKEYRKVLKMETDPAVIIDNEKTQELLTNSDLRNFIATLDIKDLQGFLSTGKSAKYGEERLLGTWTNNFPAALMMAKQDNPDFLPNELIMYRREMPERFQSAILVAGLDKNVSIKLPRNIEGTPCPSVPGSMPRVSYTGTWTRNGDTYELNLHAKQGNHINTSPVRIQKIVVGRSGGGEVEVERLSFKINNWVICFDRIPD
jgi:hypothetical protein